MTPRQWANESRAVARRDEDHLRRTYLGAVLYSRALAGKLPPIAELLKASTMRRHSLDPMAVLSEHLGIAPRPISPEALDALRRARGE